MNLIATERIKLFSTKSAYWCLASTVAAALLFALMMGLVTVDGTQFASTGTSQSGMGLAMMIFAVLATLSVTTEYRFSTIRSTFLAAPNRTAVLVSKTVLLMVVGAAIALVSSLGAFFMTKALATRPIAPVELASPSDWRMVTGYAALFAITAVIAVAVGTLIRQSAGAISLLLVWAALLEGLVTLIPRWGAKISPWLPFNAGGAFTTDFDTYNQIGAMGGGPGNIFDATMPTPLQGLLVFAGTGLVLWVLAAFLLNRRDA